MVNDTQKELRVRLKADRKWSAFVELRAKYKADGLPAKEAKAQALTDLYPVDAPAVPEGLSDHAAADATEYEEMPLRSESEAESEAVPFSPVYEALSTALVSLVDGGKYPPELDEFLWNGETTDLQIRVWLVGHIQHLVVAQAFARDALLKEGNATETMDAEIASWILERVAKLGAIRVMFRGAYPAPNMPGH